MHARTLRHTAPGLAVLAAVLAGLLLLAGVAALGSGQDPVPVITLEHVQAGLAHDPQAWAHRRVRVRAIAGGCIPWAEPKSSPCVDEGPALVQIRAGTLVASLPVICGQVPQLAGVVRDLPWLGWLAGAPQALFPGKPAVYQIWLPPAPGYDAPLLDSLPGCGAN